MSDLISREAVLEHYRVTDPQGTFAYCSSILEFVESLPAAEPEQRIGRWIYGQDERFVSCSECGMKTTRNELKGIALFGKDEPKFCPNCGAKMEGESMSDLIDRQKLLYDIEKHHVSDGKFQHWVQIQQQAQPEQRWIPVSERLPEEEDSIFARYYGTDSWRKSMFRKKSREVIVTSVFKDGELHTEVAHTTDGEWRVGVNAIPRMVIAWMPLPEPYKEGENVSDD